MKKFIILLTILFFIFSNVVFATTFYLDYVNGDDANAGDSFAAGHPWKTITTGCGAADIAPGDIIKIAKSPAPASIGNGTWTNLSKTVTLATAGTVVIDLCETAWTGAGDCTVARTAVATDGKEGSYCMKLTLDAAVQASILQAYYDIYTHDTTVHNLSAYQKISFWIKNSGAIVANNWIVNLCSDVAGATAVDSFLVPAIPSTSMWLPLTLTKVGGGNLGAAIKSIAIYSGGTTTGMASNYIYVDDFIACTTDGLNLQSLISKNSAEQGGTEGWYGIQSINGTAVLLDNDVSCKGNAGRGYSTSGTTPETVETFKRETIKTDLVASAAAPVHTVNDSGTLALGNIQFQGGYDTTSGEQTGETFFDGLNGFGYGIYLSDKSYTTLNYLNLIRYSYGIYYKGSGAKYNTITTLSNTNNNTNYGIYLGKAADSSRNNTITTLSNANNNGVTGVDFTSTYNNIITTLSNANNNNTNYGVYFEAGALNNTIFTLSNANNNGVTGVDFAGDKNTVVLLSNANSNAAYGVYFNVGTNNIVRSLSTTGNTTGGVYCNAGSNYLNNALIAEGTEITVANFSDYYNFRFYSNNHDQDTTKNFIYTDNGLISSVATDRVGGTGIMWKLAVTSSTRDSFYPLKLSIAKIACVSSKLVTVKVYMKITSTTDILGALVCPGRQLTGITVADVKQNASTADTDWHELTITFTPTQAGVIEIEAWAWWVASTADESVYVEDMTITQAD